jgi:hypothetical protein
MVVLELFGLTLLFNVAEAIVTELADNVETVGGADSKLIPATQPFGDDGKFISHHVYEVPLKVAVVGPAVTVPMIPEF